MGIAIRGNQTYTVTLQAEAVSASTAYVLVDLSDTTNFKHTRTSHTNLLGLILTTEKASDGAYDIWVGTVIENDATDGTAAWCQVFHLEASGNATDSTDRFAWQVDYTLGGGNPEGLNLKVTAAGAMAYQLSNISLADSAYWQNDTGLASPAGAVAGATGKPGVGDLVVLVEETAGTGTIDFCLTAIYETY